MGAFKNSEINISDLLDRVLNSVDIIAFGETYHGHHNKIVKELAENLCRFRGIFLEIPTNYQKSVDDYLRNGVLGDVLQGYLLRSLGEGKNVKDTLIYLLDAARKYSVPVFCIDSSKVQDSRYINKSEYGHYFLRGRSRNEDMFKNIQNIFNNSGGKWCVLAGRQHLRIGKHFRSKDDTLGKRLINVFRSKFYNVCLINKMLDDLNIEERGFDEYVLHD